MTRTVERVGITRRQAIGRLSRGGGMVIFGAGIMGMALDNSISNSFDPNPCPSAIPETTFTNAQRIIADYKARIGDAGVSKDYSTVRTLAEQPELSTAIKTTVDFDQAKKVRSECLQQKEEERGYGFNLNFGRGKVFMGALIGGLLVAFAGQRIEWSEEDSKART